MKGQGTQLSVGVGPNVQVRGPLLSDGIARNVKVQRTLLSAGIARNAKVHGTLLSADVASNVKVLTYLLTYLLMPVYSLGAWAIDQSSPPDPALRQGDNFLPGYLIALTSDSMSRSQVFLGRPLFLFPRGFHVSACLVMLDVGFLTG